MTLPLLALLLQVQVPATPQRHVADPGIVATGMTTTPAGVHSVFEGRVMGVRFGASSSELWVAARSGVWHLAWRDNRVIARGEMKGHPGVHGLAYDRVADRALVAAVGRVPENATIARLPGSQPFARNSSSAQLAAYDARPHRGIAKPVKSLGGLGAYQAGGPAVSSRAASGPRVAVVPLTADDRLAILDADADTLLRVVPLGVAPVAAAVSADGSVVWVTNLGGTKPGDNEPAVMQCCDPAAERVRVDARGIAAPGSVARIDVATGAVTDWITVGRHPTGLAWDEAHDRLYVADGNDDAITVIGTRTRGIVETIAIAPFTARGIGLAPTAVALAPDGHTLFVSLGGINAVAMFDVSGASAKLRGLIPTDWYPSSLDVSADGRWLAVGALFGVGSGTGEAGGSGKDRARYVFSERGSASVVAIPEGGQLAAYTAAVARNVKLALAGGAPAELPPRSGVAARAVPERLGEPSLVDHVVLIVRENRTYDQVLGDLDRGDGDSSLVIFGPRVTPNAHALSRDFVTLDRVFANGGNSADGHQWLTQANETEYTTWPLYLGRSYPSEADDPLAYSSGGFLWDAARAAGKSVAVFGEYAPAPSDSVAAVRNAMLADWRARGSDPAYWREQLARRYDTHARIPSLDSVLVREYPGWTQETPDVVKAEDVLSHVGEWVRDGAMPNLVIILLPSDHTDGLSPDWTTPRANVADNDYALGRVVESLSATPFWRSMAIFSIEDDAQDGVDHVDGHRTVALAASPFIRRGAVDHTFYTQASILRTIELMLGIRPLSVFDLVATDMRESFIAPGEQPDFTPYHAAVPEQSIYDVNPRVGAIHGPDAAARRVAARASAHMRLDIPDAAPSELLNRILWHDVRGWATPYPAVQHAVFFPLSLDVDDDDR